MSNRRPFSSFPAQRGLLWHCALFCLMILGLTACGKRPVDVDAPLSITAHGKTDTYPRIYPHEEAPNLSAPFSNDDTVEFLDE